MAYQQLPQQVIQQGLYVSSTGVTTIPIYPTMDRMNCCCSFDFDPYPREIPFALQGRLSDDQFRDTIDRVNQIFRETLSTNNSRKKFFIFGFVIGFLLFIMLPVIGIILLTTSNGADLPFAIPIFIGGPVLAIIILATLGITCIISLNKLTKKFLFETRQYLESINPSLRNQGLHWKLTEITTQNYHHHQHHHRNHTSTTYILELEMLNIPIVYQAPSTYPPPANVPAIIPTIIKGQDYESNINVD